MHVGGMGSHHGVSQVMWAGLLIAVLIVVVAFAAYAVGARRIVKSLGEPTPETAKIEAQTVEQARAIVNEGEADKREVLNADRDHLLDELRNRVRHKR